MDVLAVIPARAGSKRVPNKNIAPLAGRPLLAYTCEVARAAGVFSRIYVNTDSARIAAIANEHGIGCPILRPAALACDQTSTALAMRFFLSYLVEHDESYDALMILQPTSPLRSVQDIHEALELYETHRPAAVVSGCPVAPASWLGRVGRDGRLEDLAGDDPIYKRNGAIYVYDFDAFLFDRQPPRTMLYPMPVERSVDIDTPADWQYAEFLIQSRRVRAVR